MEIVLDYGLIIMRFFSIEMNRTIRYKIQDLGLVFDA
jgi:hypothetical protein